jgi:hypothetical protein
MSRRMGIAAPVPIRRLVSMTEHQEVVGDVMAHGRYCPVRDVARGRRWNAEKSSVMSWCMGVTAPSVVV